MIVMGAPVQVVSSASVAAHVHVHALAPDLAHGPVLNAAAAAVLVPDSAPVPVPVPVPALALAAAHSDLVTQKSS